MSVIRMRENDQERLSGPPSRSGNGSFDADIHHTTSMILNGNASDYPIMGKILLDENALEGLRMCENGPHPGMACGVILCWYILYGMHDDG